MKLETKKDKKKFDFVFVVLCYRNIDDLVGFINNVNKSIDNFKIIVVNSYYDDETKYYFSDLAQKTKCDFINVPNNGYGAGNNRGIEYAQCHYEFEYLVICNPDIEFVSFSKASIENMTDYIIAPDIKTLKGKKQNPFINKSNSFIEWLEYYGYKNHLTFLLFTGFAINKAFRETSNLIHKIFKTNSRKIYASHGSCLILGNKALERIGTPYDENMFLFCEEFHLAKLAKERKVDTIMVPEVQILHKEDGSVSFIGETSFNIQAKSFIYYYEKWYK